jgi:hypothetical protein
VDQCDEWTRQNPDVDEAQLKCAYDALNNDAAKISSNLKKTGNSRSDHVDKMNRMTASYCLNEGNQFLEACDEEGMKKAIESFRRAWMIGRDTGHVGHMVEASKRIGHIRRLMIETESNIADKLQLCVHAVVRLANAMELDNATIIG